MSHHYMHACTHMHAANYSMKEIVTFSGAQRYRQQCENAEVAMSEAK